jgi:hypothetical protein
MAKTDIESMFQIKDPYLKLHDTEEFLAKQKELKKEARFEDAILRQSAYDPYYHKNQFNLSQTYHNIDYIFYPSQEPFHRPKIDEAYIEANPKGTKTFYPSFLPGKYVDVEKKEREFDLLLIRDLPKSPSEEEILQALVTECIEMEQNIALLQNDIQFRLSSLQEQNSSYPNTFKNYYRNLCDWMFTGKLKENMNEKVLKDEKGLVEGADYDFASIPNLNSIHEGIIAIDRETKSMDVVLSSVDENMNSTRNEQIREQRKQLEKDMNREELLAQLRKKIQEDNAALEIEKQKKIREIAEKSGVYIRLIEKIKDSYDATYLTRMKAHFVEGEYTGKIGSWNTLVDMPQQIELDLKSDFLKTLSTQKNDIGALKKKLLLLYKYFDKEAQKIKENISYAKSLEEELMLMPTFDAAETEENIRLLQEFNQNLDDTMNQINTMICKIISN